MSVDGDDRRRTAETIRETADSLENSEAILHDSAERAHDESTRQRLHALGDEVTRQAKKIYRRADAIAPPETTG